MADGRKADHELGGREHRSKACASALRPADVQAHEKKALRVGGEIMNALIRVG